YGATSPMTVSLTYNNFTFKNPDGYTILIGADPQGYYVNMYNGTQFIGNSLIGSGVIGSSSNDTHGLFLGGSVAGIWKYNLVQNGIYGISTKSYGGDNTGGYIAYNVIYNTRYSIDVKGTKNTLIYNNTLYANDQTTTSYNYAMITIAVADDGTNPSTGTIIKNNI